MGAAAGARGPCDKGLGRETGACLPFGCTALGLVASAGCPQCRGLRAEPAGALTVRLHRVSSCVGRRMSTLQSVRSSSGFRHSPSKSTARRVGVGRRYPHRRIPASSMRRAHSPFRCTGLRVDRAARYPHLGRPASQRSGALARVWISPPADTRNPVSFDGEHRHATKQGRRFGCGQIDQRRLETL